MYISNKCIITIFGIEVLISVISALQQTPGMKEDSSKGRIPEFDEVIMRYSTNIADGNNMDYLLKDLKMTAKGIAKLDHVMAGYYYEVCEGIGAEGDQYIISERNRANQILMGEQDSSESEEEYAYKRKNVLEAFIDSAAQAVMDKFNMQKEQVIEVNPEELVHTINLDNIDLTSKDGKPKTIHIDPSKFKVKTEKAKKKKHDEM